MIPYDVRSTVSRYSSCSEHSTTIHAFVVFTLKTVLTSIQLLLLLLLIHTFSVLSLQLKKLRWHNKSAIDLSNANPACGHKEVRRSTGHIMVTTRYSDQQGSKSRQKVMRLYKQWHRPISKRFIKPPYSIREQPRSTRNVVAYPRPAFSAKNRKNYAPTSFDQQVQVSQGHTFCTEIRKIEIPRSMVVEALNW